MEQALEISSLTRAYREGGGSAGCRLALDSVSLSVAQGEFVALTGRSGSGKTTLLNVVGGLDRGWSGSVRVLGRDIGAMRDRELSRLRNSGIGFVFQAFHLLSHLTVLQNATLPGHFSGGDMKLAGSRAAEALDRVGLLDRADAFPWQLSAGERQRVAIARAILNRPSILLCDEPTGNLDALTGRTVIDIFRAVNGDDHTTLVIATHDDNVAAAANRVVRLENGRVI